MSKVKPNPHQEVFPIEAAPVSQPEPLDPVKYLNANNGLILLEDLPGFNLDWERKVSLAGLMGEIGVALSEEPAQSEVSDRALGVYGKEFQNVLPSVIVPSLYWSGAEARRRTDVLWVNWAEPTYTGPGVLAQDEAVAVTSSEFRPVQKSPELVGKHMSADVGASGENKPDIDDEDLKNRRGRSRVYKAREGMEKIATMDRVLEIEQIGLNAWRELATFGKDAPKLSLGEVDFYRRLGLFPILQMIRVASAQLDYGTNERQGAIRAATVAMTRWKRPERRIAFMRKYAEITYRYTNAKRGKFAQAYSGCEIEYNKHKHFLATKEPSVDIS